MTSVLVAVGSKHGSTAEIGRRIAAVIEGRGISASFAEPDAVDDVSRFQGFVIGSAVYAGHWTKESRQLVERLGAAMAGRPVWLFSSGPIGDPPKPEEDPVDVAEISIETEARDHRVFAGCLDKSKLSFGERAIVTALRAPYGDYRDWDEIEAWASTIAQELMAEA